jgi:SAM-dependent MidA family methyltransferase
MIPRSERPPVEIKVDTKKTIVSIEHRHTGTLLTLDCGHTLIQGKLHEYQRGETMYCVFCGPYANAPAIVADADRIAELLRAEPLHDSSLDLF